MEKVRLGQKVRDTITGYEGIAVARTEWLYGCVRIAIQSNAMKDGLPVENYTVDEPQVELVKDAPANEPRTSSHGGRPSISRPTGPSRARVNR